MRIRNVVYSVLLLALSSLGFGQTQPFTGTITTATAGPGNCVQIRAQNNSTVGMTVSGTWSGTITPSVYIVPARSANKKVLPLDGSTAQATITANGTFVANIGGFLVFQLCATAWTSGTATVDIYSTPAPNNSTIASSTGGGTVTGVSGVAPIASTGGATPAISLQNSTPANITTALGTDTGFFSASGSAATSGDVISGDAQGGIHDSGTALSNVPLLNASNAFTGTTQTFPAGTTTNPGFNFSGQASNTGFYAPSTTSSCFLVTGTCDFFMGTTGLQVSNTGLMAFTQGSGANGTAGAAIGLAGTTTTEAFDFTKGTSTGLTLAGNACKPTSAVTLSGAAFTTICSWTLPNVAKTWGLICDGIYSLTSGTTPTLILGYIASQAPTGITASASIFSTLTGTSTQGTQTTTTSTAQQTILTGVTNTQANAQFRIFGTVQASATSGTFILNAEMGGTTPAGTVNVGTVCWLF